MDRLMLIIPAYNEEKSIGKVIRSLNFPPKDIIVVDDGSTDNTYMISRTLGVHTLRHKKNMGKGMAHRTAFKFATDAEAGWVITMDADGQHSPQDIPKFLHAIKENRGDIIIGTRRISVQAMPYVRLQTNLWTSFVISLLSGVRVRDSQSGYRAIRKKIFATIPLSTNNFQAESEIIIKAARRGFKISSVPIRTIYNVSSSKIKPLLDTLRFMKLVLQSMWL